MRLKTNHQESFASNKFGISSHLTMSTIISYVLLPNTFVNVTIWDFYFWWVDRLKGRVSPFKPSGSRWEKTKSFRYIFLILSWTNQGRISASFRKRMRVTSRSSSWNLITIKNASTIFLLDLNEWYKCGAKFGMTSTENGVDSAELLREHFLSIKISSLSFKVRNWSQIMSSI